MSFERGPTSLDLLQIRWDYPVYVPEAAKDEQTRSQSVFALPRDEAFALVRGTDPRPLLVLRECILCKRDDSAMLDKRRSNERTILLSHFFHCVKLPTHVAQKGHPLRNLFDAERPAHVFVASADGSGLIPMSGAQSQKELWNAMTQVLRRDYAGKPDQAVDGILKLLDQFDRVDAKETRLQDELDQELERSGKDSAKHRRLSKQLDEARAEHDQLVEELQLLQAVDLR